MTTTERDRGIVRPAIGAAIAVTCALVAVAGELWDIAVDRANGARAYRMLRRLRRG